MGWSQFFVNGAGAKICFLIKGEDGAEEEVSIFHPAGLSLFLRISLLVLVSPSFQNLVRT